MILIREFTTLDSYISSTEKLPKDFAKITIDNRDIKDCNVFVAIIGERYNPLTELHKLQGKIKFIVYDKNIDIKEEHFNEFIFIKVKNSVKFCEEAASIISRKFQKTKTLFCIAGSNGKTTTKEMISHILKEIKIPFISTYKNNNNNLGVALTLFQIRENTEIAIVELGSNHPGEMAKIHEICAPAYGVVTNIGYTHMEFFPTLDDVFKEEASIFYEINKKNGPKLFFKNEDDDYLKKLDSSICISYGREGMDYAFSFIDNGINVCDKKLGDEYKITNTFITGEHNFFNLALSFIVVKKITTFKVAEILSATQSFKPTSNRSEWINFRNKKVYLDAYNANPSSMEASILAFIKSIGKNNIDDSLFILGDMNELGSHSQKLHLKIGKLLCDLGIKNARFVGRFSGHYKSGLSCGETYVNAMQYRDIHFVEDLSKFSYIFIKGSRSLQLESILDIK